MAKRDELLAVIRERQGEIARHVSQSDRQWWRPALARFRRQEAHRLSELNMRDLKQLPPLSSYRGPVNVRPDA